jgi:hypothetical protein
MLLMRIFIYVVLVIFFSPINSISGELEFPKFDADFTDSNCKEKWTKRGVYDENMHKVCMQHNRDYYEGAFAIFNEYKSEKRMHEVVKFQIKRFTKRGNIDWVQVKVNLALEKEGFLDVEYMIQQNEVSQDTLNKCKKKWFPEYRRMRYCIKKGN